MWKGMDLVRTYFNETEAEVDRARLEATGIPAVVAKDNCGGMRPHFDLQQGVRLLVKDEDAAAARDLLGSGTAAGDTAWTCSSCAAPGDPGYDACWSCGQPRA
jgi:hypothetical protein